MHTCVVHAHTLRLRLNFHFYTSDSHNAYYIYMLRSITVEYHTDYVKRSHGEPGRSGISGKYASKSGMSAGGLFDDVSPVVVSGGV